MCHQLTTKCRHICRTICRTKCRKFICPVKAKNSITPVTAVKRRHYSNNNSNNNSNISPNVTIVTSKDISRFVFTAKRKLDLNLNRQESRHLFNYNNNNTTRSNLCNNNLIMYLQSRCNLRNNHNNNY